MIWDTQSGVAVGGGVGGAVGGGAATGCALSLPGAHLDVAFTPCGKSLVVLSSDGNRNGASADLPPWEDLGSPLHRPSPHPSRLSTHPPEGGRHRGFPPPAGFEDREPSNPLHHHSEANLLNLESGQLLGSFRVVGGCFSLSPDGARLALSSSFHDGQTHTSSSTPGVTLMDASTGVAVHTLHTTVAVIKALGLHSAFTAEGAHEASVGCLSFSPDSTLLLGIVRTPSEETADEGRDEGRNSLEPVGRLIVWDCQSGQALETW